MTLFLIGVGVGVAALLTVSVVAFVALLEQAPLLDEQPTGPRFAHELDSGLGAYADAAYQREWDAHVASAPEVVDLTDLDRAETVEDVVRGWTR